MTLSDIEQNLMVALKARDSVTASTLRLLLARLKNERIAAGELTEAAITTIIQSEYKRRKEAADEFTKGNRPELAEAELTEARVLEQFLPAQVSEAEIIQTIESLKASENWTTKDFGIAMKKLKEQFGASADGALLARVLKEKLN